MRLGFDIDGVLADFVYEYQQLFINLTGHNYFHEGDSNDPPVWNWPQFRGYSDADAAEVWKVIGASATYWMDLPVSEHMLTLRHMRGKLFAYPNEIYFITNRTGVAVKYQTEQWLRRGFGARFGSDPTPTVLVVDAGMKGVVAKALRLDAYIDDHYGNVMDVINNSPDTRPYLLHRRYNKEWWSNGGKDIPSEHVIYDSRVEAARIVSVAAMLRAEGI